MPLLLSLAFYTGALPFLMAFKNYARVVAVPTYTVRESRVKILALSLLTTYFALRSSFLVKFLFQGGIFAIFSIMQTYSKIRYEYATSESLSLVFQLGSISYFCLMGAVGLILSIKFRFSWALIIVFISFIEMMEGTRARVLIGTVILLAEYIMARNSSLMRQNLRSYFISFLFLFIVAAIIFFIPQYARIYNTDNVIEIILFDKLPSYTLAMYEALSLWIRERDLFVLDFGYNTFAGMFKFFGFTFQQGFYEFTHTNFGMTNIYTNMRNVLSDFGIIFSIFIYFFIGYMIGYASLKKVGFFHLMIVKLSLIFILFPINSPFIFANTVFGISLFFLFYTFCFRYRVRW